ncbi:MAG: PEGA domain-containing protein, partial [Myxococcales bacterium]|nr:PEGA domain-containing protein [Myxococcales bacterium]
ASASKVTRALDRAWRRPKMRRAGLSALAGVAALLLVGGLGLAYALRDDTGRVSAAAAPAIADDVRPDRPVAPAPAPTATTTEVSATLDSLPPGAEVWADGVLIGTTPLVAPLAAGAALEVELRLDGYEPARHLFAAIETPQRVRLARVRRRPSPSANRPAAPAATTAMRGGAAYERFD